MIEALIFGLIVLDIYVFYRLWKSEALEKTQKALQAILVVVLPVVGAVFIFLFVRNIEKDAKVEIAKEFGGGPQESVSNADAFHGSD